MILAYRNIDKPEIGLFDNWPDVYAFTCRVITDFRTHGSSYTDRKEYARNIAMDIQDILRDVNISWLECLIIQDELTRLAKNYGLVREFKENCII